MADPIKNNRKADIAVAASGNTELLVLDIPKNREVLGMSIENANLYALDAFILSIRFNDLGPWLIIANTAANWTTAITSPLKWSSGDLTTLVKNTDGGFLLETRGISTIKLEASANTTATKVTLTWGSK